MSLWRPFRILYIKTTDFTHGFQGEPSKMSSFYKYWAPFYDFSIKLDPAYQRELENMISLVVKKGDSTLDIGCGTGLGSLYAASLASEVVSVDASEAMTDKLYEKIRSLGIENIEIRNGYFPDVLVAGEEYDSVISSFMLAHLMPEERKKLLSETYNILSCGGRVGLFSAQGEIASIFEEKEEIMENLESVGFQEIKIDDVSDIYRISTAVKL